MVPCGVKVQISVVEVIAQGIYLQLILFTEIHHSNTEESAYSDLYP